MLTPITLEVFADNVSAVLRAFGEKPHFSAPWVARILGRHPKFRFDRDFVRGMKDYSKANGAGSRGVYSTYWLEPGIYEVAEKRSWGSSRRYFCVVYNGEVTEIPEGEVDAWLEKLRSA
jgi:hypothetical protein